MKVQWVVRATGLRQKREGHAGDTDVGASSSLMVMETLGMHKSQPREEGSDTVA